MQQWEYRTVRLSWIVALTNNKGWKPIKIDEKVLPNWRDAYAYASIADFCNQMGQDGWELVSVVGKEPDFLLFFKRSINDSIVSPPTK